MATPNTRSSHAARRSRSRSGTEAARRRSTRRLAAFLGNGAFVLLGLSILALGAVLVVVSRQGSVGTGAGAGAGAAAGVNGQATATPNVWIPLRSTAPADIVAAARQSTLFQESAVGSGDHAHDLSRVGTPVLVRALPTVEQLNTAFPDFYVLPILDGSGATVEAAEAQLNPARTALHVITLVTYAQPRAHGAVARLDAATAVAAVRAEQHTALRAGASPELVYFPGDAAAQETGQVTWQGGGELPADPMWLVPGADGHDHLAGTDGHAYDLKQLPMVEG